MKRGGTSTCTRTRGGRGSRRRRGACARGASLEMATNLLELEWRRNIHTSDRWSAVHLQILSSLNGLDI